MTVPCKCGFYDRERPHSTIGGGNCKYYTQWRNGQYEKHTKDQAAEIERLKNEIETLRLYGNKDCTAMADAVIASWKRPKEEQ